MGERDETGRDLERGIAIIGMAIRVAGARDLEEYRRNVFAGVESISLLSDGELLEEGIDTELLADPSYVKAKGVIEGVDRFDGEFFGYSGSEALSLDPKTRVLHEVAYHALEDAGYARRPEVPVGVFVGASEDADWLRRSVDRLSERGDGLETGLLLHKDQLAQQLAYRLDLRGPTFALYTACSTSLAAVHLACRSLESGECDLAVAGGVTVDLPRRQGHLWREGMVYSRDGHCRPFDAEASGFVFGDGAAVVVLKRCAQAVADRDRIHAVILGTAVNNDGRRKVGFVAPSLQGQAEVIRRALAAARVSSESIGYVEAHGTGTVIGDPVELAGLVAAFGGGRPGRCALGSSKAAIGHTHAAAGTAGLIKAALVVGEGRIPPLVNFRQPNAELVLDGSPFYLPESALPWPDDLPVRRAGVSSFGLGGTNAHAIIEAPPPRPAVPAGRCFVLPFSARRAQALEPLEQALRAAVERADAGELARLAYTQQLGRREMEHRGVLLVKLDSPEGASLRRLASPAPLGAARPRLGLEVPDPRRLGAAARGLPGALYADRMASAVVVAAELQPSLPLDLPGLTAAAGDGDLVASGCLAFAYGQVLVELLPDVEVLVGFGAGELVAAALAGVMSWPGVVAALVSVAPAQREVTVAPRSPGDRTLLSARTGRPVTAHQLADDEYWQRALGGGEGPTPNLPRDVLWVPRADAVEAALAAGDGGGEELRFAWQSLLSALWCRGFELQWSGLAEPEVPGRTSAPLYPFAPTEVPLPPRVAPAAPAAPHSDGTAAGRRTARPAMLVPYRAPATPLGRRVVDLLEEVLETTPIGMDDGFVDLGGDSLSGTQLVMRLERTFGLRLDAADLLDNPTPRQLVDQLAMRMVAARDTETSAAADLAAEERRS